MVFLVTSGFSSTFASLVHSGSVNDEFLWRASSVMLAFSGAALAFTGGLKFISILRFR